MGKCIDKTWCQRAAQAIDFDSVGCIDFADTLDLVAFHQDIDGLHFFDSSIPDIDVGD